MIFNLKKKTKTKTKTKQTNKQTNKNMHLESTFSEYKAQETTFHDKRKWLRELVTYPM